MKLLYATVALVLFLGSCSKTETASENTSTVHDVHSILWRYKIKPENRKTFEFQYGEAGNWAKLFKRSPHYRGSFLHKSEDDSNTYILIDTWDNKEDYNVFKQDNKAAYDSLSAAFEYLYNSEEKMGEFTSVTAR